MRRTIEKVTFGAEAPGCVELRPFQSTVDLPTRLLWTRICLFCTIAQQTFSHVLSSHPFLPGATFLCSDSCSLLYLLASPAVTSTTDKFLSMALSNGFVNAVGKLKQYPAANLIGEIQEASRIEGDAKAALIMDYLTQRVLNVPASYKVPLIYAIDAIVKSLRGNFVNELSKKLVNFYLICFRM